MLLIVLVFSVVLCSDSAASSSSSSSNGQQHRRAKGVGSDALGHDRGDGHLLLGTGAGQARLTETSGLDDEPVLVVGAARAWNGCQLQFDSTKGYPGEGPTSHLDDAEAFGDVDEWLQADQQAHLAAVGMAFDGFEQPPEVCELPNESANVLGQQVAAADREARPQEVEQSPGEEPGWTPVTATPKAKRGKAAYRRRKG